MARNSLGKTVGPIRLLILLSSVVMGIGTIAAGQTKAHSGGTDQWGCHAGSQPYHCHNPKNNYSDNYGNSGDSYTSNSYWNVPLSPSVCILSYTTALSKEDIALVQSVLKRKGYRPGPVDGIYGRMTRAGLNRFESKWKLPKSRGTYLENSTLRKLGVLC